MKVHPVMIVFLNIGTYVRKSSGWYNSDHQLDAQCPTALPREST